MGKKGAKKKTRWQILSIDTPPSKKDEEEEVQNGYDQEEHTKEYNGYAPGGRRKFRNWTAWNSNGQSSNGSGEGAGSATSGYGTGDSHPRRRDSSNSQQRRSNYKIDEYTRVSTPRLDILFKKNTFAQKIHWKGTMSTSATPSTTESQSASHSTADGSEAAEDQQLFDYGPSGDYGMSYGTYYDHASGYYYEYPMMVVAPVMPEQVVPNIFAPIPCNAVPLRPIEWVNPAFVPKFASQQYCYMDSQVAQVMDCVDAQPVTEPAPTNGLSSGSASASGSVADEPLAVSNEMQPVVQTPPELEEPVIDQPTAYIETLPPQPVHLAHVIPQPMTQPYLYPGQYMFGPPVVNVNGVTIQSGPMNRCSNVESTTRHRRKKKKRKLMRPYGPGNTDAEDEDEEDFSNSEVEEDQGTLSPPACRGSNQPLNPECEEFHLRRPAEPDEGSLPPENNEPKRLTEHAEGLTNGNLVNGYQDSENDASTTPCIYAGNSNNRESTPDNGDTNPIAEVAEVTAMMSAIETSDNHGQVDSGFESQTKLNNRPITQAVTEWLNRARSPDLFIIPSAAIRDIEDDDDDDDDYDDDDLANEQSKNLQGNPMLALSFNGTNAEIGEFAGTIEDRSKKGRGTKRKGLRDPQNGDLGAQVKESNSTELVCKIVDEDSDANVRVAKKSRITDVPVDSVKTYEKGDIVVSMDGKFLRVRNDSLGSIDEPDVLDCWEPETIETIPPCILEESDHVHKYYRLHAEDEVSEVASSVDSIEEALEVYESFYNGKNFHRDEEGPVPCRPVCCNVQ